MSELTIKRVTGRREQKQFLRFPWDLYRGDPNWIPPLRDNQAELVGYKPHPFYERNLVQTFLAVRDGEVCGRIAAILNSEHNHYRKERRGFFGFFECVDDQQVADALMDAVAAWFADQGIYSLRGPANPSMNYEVGLLVDGFDSPPTFMMTYNPAYYARLIENCGFRKTQDLYSYWGHVSMLPKIQAKLAPMVEGIIGRYDIRLRPLDRSHFQADVEAFLTTFNRALTTHWGFVPMTGSEIEHVARGLRYLIVPEMAIAAEIDGKIAGVTFALPDYNPRIKQIDGRLFPFGFLRLLRNKRQIKKVRVISTNVLPEYQLMGVGLVLMHGLVPLTLDWKIEEAEFSWVVESNSLSRGSLEKGGAKLEKTFRLYDRDNPQAAEKALTQRRAATAICPVAGATVSPLEIREVGTAADRKEFIALPWRIYAEDPQWVPPLALEVKEFLDRRKHPFYLHGEATQFLATRGGVAVGRILVSDDPRFNQQHGTNCGCFGMFESVDDPATAQGLLDAAAAWLRGRGRTAIRGPIDYSMNYPCGLLIDGFDTPPRVMMNHNRPYYAGLLESWGLKKGKDLFCWWFNDPLDMLARWRVRAERIARRTGVTIRPFRKDDFDNEIRRCLEVYNEGLEELWGFVKLTDEEFRYLARRLTQITPSELALMAEVDGRLVGFSVTSPDINEAIRPLDGRLTNYGLPINLAKLIYRQRHIKTARMLILDLLKEYRRRGIAELLILKTLEYGKNVMHYTGAELGWTLEDNEAVNRTIETVGGRRHKTYRIYEKPLET